MVPLYSLSNEHVNFNLWKWDFDRFCLFDFSILSVNCSYVCFIYVEIYEKISSGGLEVSLSIFSEDHNDIFDHKYHTDQGNLFSI